MIIAIESSCDDTSVAVVKGFTVMSNVVATQEVHRQWGGVVPELASRAHLKHIVPVVHSAMEKAGVTMDQLDAVAFTQGPGLIGSLLVGASFAKSLALALGRPLIAVNHMEAHIAAHYLDDNPQPVTEHPFLCMTVSGGHTQLVTVPSLGRFELLGQTLDDAAGEAFDKSAKMLGLPYPGGPEMDRLAQKGDPDKFSFAKTHVEGLDMSFSGLKTSILYFLQKHKNKNPDFVQDNLADLCASIQKSIIDILLEKLDKTLESHRSNHIALAGGVSANSELRRRFQELADHKGIHAHIPKFEYCTDNAAMIAAAAQVKFSNGEFAELDITPQARMPL